jgi:flagellar basal body rod protein FlgB
MLDTLLSQSAVPTIEKAVRFSGARHKVLAENVVNLSTPGYRGKDLDFASFSSELRRELDRRDAGGPAPAGPLPQLEARRHLVFHDGATRDVEQLMADQAQNALRHNLGVELLRKQYGLMHMAIRERVA